ncbi:hypothetical protein HZH66_010601 [Vespula vulgaris]|uniref:Uncharacterized protein n=1 Tax=Vespula vulgaris TaxID=7454 RepID=A0A834JGB2_VESVU|nr:hypothetical protein HZH66_010601 [Vespula vulgaris]
MFHETEDIDDYEDNDDDDDDDDDVDDDDDDDDNDDDDDDDNDDKKRNEILETEFEGLATDCELQVRFLRAVTGGSIPERNFISAPYELATRGLRARVPSFPELDRRRYYKDNPGRIS